MRLVLLATWLGLRWRCELCPEFRGGSDVRRKVRIFLAGWHGSVVATMQGAAVDQPFEERPLQSKTCRTATRATRPVARYAAGMAAMSARSPGQSSGLLRPAVPDNKMGHWRLRAAMVP